MMTLLHYYNDTTEPKTSDVLIGVRPHGDSFTSDVLIGVRPHGDSFTLL